MTSSWFDAIPKRLLDELIQLHDAWHQYQFLFGGSKERVRMLNACAAWFFGVTQRSLLRETILGISRLTDSATLGKYDNLVLSSLLSDPALNVLPDVKEELASAIQDAVEAAQPVRVHRNKYIAHLDHATAIGAPDEPLPALSRSDISAVIAKVEAAYNVHGRRVRGTDNDFALHTLRSADALVQILEHSERWKRYRALHPPDATDRE